MTQVVRSLGLDPGPRNTGWALMEFSRGRRIIVDGDVWTSEGDDVDSQIRQIGARLEAYLGTIPTPDVIGIEAWTYRRDGASFSANTMSVPRVIERLRTIADVLGIPVYVVTTTDAKRSLFLEGACSKDRVRRAVEDQFRASLKSVHSRDAVAVAVAAQSRWHGDSIMQQRRHR